MPVRGEPFRLLFPLGVLLGWVGVSHWLLYATGVTSTYSCLMHGVVQMQAFMLAFALGFLLTAIPRRTQSAPPSAAALAVAVAGLVVVTGAAARERWALSQAGYLVVLGVIVVFATRRLAGGLGGRRPPAAFVLIPLALLHGVAGALLIVAWSAGGAPPWTEGLGRLLVTQGVFLCLVMGVGSLVIPLMSGAVPPADLGSSPAERRKLVAYATAGLGVFLSLVAEQAGWERSGPLARAAIVAAALALGAGALGALGRPGVNRKVVRLAVWCAPLGLAASGLWPEMRVAWLHVTFIGGFSLFAFGVATHVVLSHLDLTRLREGNPPAVVAVAVLLVLALLARVAADWSDTYFEHLGIAAATWLVGSGIWLVFTVPKMLRRA